jgi:hypothetical protein
MRRRREKSRNRHERKELCLTRIPLFFVKDDVFYRGRGAIAACDATTTTTTRNKETNARGDFPASLSEK